jgi:hypothetical protein
VAGISSHRKPSESHGGGSPRIAPDPGADGERQVPQRLDDRPLSADRLTRSLGPADTDQVRDLLLVGDSTSAPL